MSRGFLDVEWPQHSHDLPSPASGPKTSPRLLACTFISMTPDLP